MRIVALTFYLLSCSTAQQCTLLHGTPGVPEETCPSTDVLKDACIETTTSFCSQACSDLLNALPPANADGESPCMDCLLEKSRKWGISDEFFCSWRSTCDVQNFPGMDCGAPILSAKDTIVTTEFRMSIDLPDGADAFFGDNAELKKWTQALSKAMTRTDDNPDGDLDLWAFIRIVPAPILIHRGRQLAIAEMQVNVDSPDDATAANNAAVLENPAFTNALKAKLGDEGAAGATSLIFDKTTIQTGSSIETYTLPVFVESNDVSRLRGYSPTAEDSKWDMFDKDYQKEIGSVLVVGIGVGFLLISMYWVFMCCHNVHWLCGKGSCLPFKMCNPCDNKKSVGSRKVGKITLCVCYAVVFVAAMSSWYGRNHFQGAVVEIGSALDLVAEKFENLDEAAISFAAEAGNFQAVTR
jgi:hypothetical protein